MPSKKEITVATLIPLGSTKLAEILIELANYDSDIEKRLERVLLSASSPKKLATSLKKQIISLAKSKRFYDYYQSDKYAEKLKAIRTSIVSDLLPFDPYLSAEVTEEFLQNSKNIIEKADDSSGICQMVLHSLGEDLALSYQKITKINLDEVVKMIFDLSINDEYGFTDNLVKYFDSTLGINGLNKLEELVKNQLKNEPETKVFEIRLKKLRLISMLENIADGLSDADKYIEACKLNDHFSHRGVEIAKRLLDANRSKEALDWLEKDDSHNAMERANLKITALIKLGKTKEAQDLRWHEFSNSLYEIYYVDFLDNEKAENREKYKNKAIEMAFNHTNIYSALNFLMWLNEEKLLRELISKRINEIDGSHYGHLRKVAQFLLSAAEPEASALLYRAMVLSVLEKAISKYYPYAISDYIKAKHCSDIFKGKLDIPNHEEFNRKLLEKHGKKTSFWNLVMEAEHKKKL
jgi:hypothetical protein